MYEGQRVNSSKLIFISGKNICNTDSFELENIDGS